jgi:hypothetical protein
MPTQILSEESRRRARSPYAAPSLGPPLARTPWSPTDCPKLTVSGNALEDRTPQRGDRWECVATMATFRTCLQVCA